MANHYLSCLFLALVFIGVSFGDEQYTVSSDFYTFLTEAIAGGENVKPKITNYSDGSYSISVITSKGPRELKKINKSSADLFAKLFTNPNIIISRIWQRGSRVRISVREQSDESDSTAPSCENDLRSEPLKAAPFEIPIPGGSMRQGTTIYVSGRPTSGASRFDINFWCGGKYGREGDMAFVINPRFWNQVIVRNTLINGSWGTEERAVSSFVFKPNTDFNMKIICESNHFVVFFNGQELFKYKHRLPYSQINRIQFTNNVSIRSCVDVPE